MLIEFDCKKNGVCVLRLKGRFITGVDFPYLRTRTDELKAAGCRMAVVDFRDVPYIDSTGIGFVVTAYTTFTNAGGQFVLMNLARRVREVLEITKLAGIIPIYEDEASAMAALTGVDDKTATPAGA